MDENKQQSELNKPLIVIMLISFLALFWIWPNFIHEPLHLLALKLTGGDGHINFDLQHIPAHPSITRTTEITSVVQGLFFMLLPSIVSIIILAILLKTKPGKYGLFTHFVLGVYLSFDLIINVTRYNTAISDFRFFQVLPTLGAISGIGTVLLLGAIVIHTMPKVTTSLHVQHLREL